MGSYGAFWCSSLGDSDAYGWKLYFTSTIKANIYYDARYIGYSVRGVLDA